MGIPVATDIATEIKLQHVAPRHFELNVVAQVQRHAVAAALTETTAQVNLVTKQHVAGGQ